MSIHPSRSRPNGVVLALLFLFLFLSAGIAAPSIAQEPEDPHAAREEIEALLAAGDWKAAEKAAKSFRRKHATTEELEKVAERLAAHAEGGAELDKIEKAFRQSSKPRTTARKLDRFLEEYREIDELAERAAELREAARSMYVLVLEDFEDRKADEDSRLTIVDDPELVKHGEKAGRWNAGAGYRTFTYESPQPDISGYDFWCAWIYNAKKGPRPGHVRIDANSGGEHYFSFFLAIDWVGWKEIRMPLRGRASQFARHGNPDWALIEYFDIYHDDDAGTPVDLVLDDIRLEKASR